MSISIIIHVIVSFFFQLKNEWSSGFHDYVNIINDIWATFDYIYTLFAFVMQNA